MSIQANVDPELGEEQFQEWVVKVATLRGWTLRYHTHDSRRSPSGFPDWVFIHPVGDIVVAELKGCRTPMRPGQLEWLNGFRHAGLHAYLWRPRHAQAVVDRLWTTQTVREPLRQLYEPDVKP